MKTPVHLVSVTVKRSLFFPFKKPWLRSVITAVLNEEKIVFPMEIGCVVTDDQNIRKFNRRYRGIDRPTDVLSFALTEKSADSAGVDFPSPPGAPAKFGDIIVSYPRAEAQARELGHSIEEELTLLLVHGTLHLLQYDHRTAGQAKKMEAREKQIISILNGPGDAALKL